MAKRKSFDVETFKTYVNMQLSRTDEYATESFKSGLCVALEEVLHRTGNYKGFNDLYWHASSDDKDSTYFVRAVRSI